MVRHFLAISSLIFGLTLITLACGAPTVEVGSAAPAAQATDVRRTAVARVQGIIANKSTPTPVPQPTATPLPSCDNAIWWTEARSHIGESRTVQGTVVATRPAADGASVLELGQPYPDPTGILVRIRDNPAPDLDGQAVCATGMIVAQDGGLMVNVRDMQAVQLVNER